VPGNQWQAQTQLAHQACLRLHRAAFQRGQCARGTAKLAYQDTRLELLQALAVAFDAGQDARHLVAESDRRGLLEVAAADDRCVAVPASQRSERIGQVLEIRFHQREGLTDLQDRGGICDVLRRCAPVAVFAQSVPAVGIDLIDYRDDRVPNLLGLGLEPRPVDLAGLAVPHNLVGRFLGNDAQFALHLGKGALDIQVLGCPVFVAPDMAHLRLTEHVAENLGVDDRRWHRSKN